MIAQYPLIPDQAFLYLPQPDRIVQDRNGTKQRIIFGGGLSLNQDQTDRVKILRSYINQNKQNSQLNGFPDDFLLRFLQAASFNYSECIDNLEQYQQWQKKMLPLQHTQSVTRYLRQGILYFCGRDYHYRPNIVVDIKKILDIKINENDLLRTLGFFFQYVIENCLIQGQVQTWNTIIDLGNCSVFSLGGTLVDIIKHLSSIFKARSNHSFLIRCPGTIKFVWGMVKGVLNEDQIRKITMSDKKTLRQQDFVKINPNQIQVKYGGTHPNIKTFWPIQISPYSFTAKDLKVSLISIDQYDRMYNQGLLKDRKIKKTFIKKFNRVSRMLSGKVEEDIMTQKNDDQQVQQEVLYPQQKRPKTPQAVQPVFSYSQLFS